MRVYESNSNVAYNLSYFDTEVRVREPEEKVKRPELEIKKNSASKVGKPIALTLFAAVVIAFFSMYIFSRAQLSDVTIQVSNAEYALTQAQEKNSDLKSELATSMSTDNVEKYALGNLNMNRLDKSQEMFFEMEADSLIESAEPPEQDFFSAVKDWFDGVLEYFRSL